MRTLIILLALAAPAAAQQITITTPERVFTTKSIEIKEVIGELAVEFEDASHKKVLLKCVDVVDISIAPLAVARQPEPMDVQLTLWTGDHVFGSLADADKDKDGVRIQSAALGDATFRFEHVESVRFVNNRAVWPRRRPEGKTDIIVTKTGDVRAAQPLRTLGKGAVVYHSRVLKKDVTLPAADCAVVYMSAATAEAVALPQTLYAIVQLTDGTALQGTITEFKGGVLKFRDLFGTERTVGAAGVGGLYFKNGRVMYLSDLAGAAVKAIEENEFIRPVGKPPSTIYPWQRDRNAKEGKLSIRDQEFRKGIGVHAKSELTFDLGGGYSKFEAMVGIDDVLRDSQGGGVVFIVHADGKEVWKSGMVTWRDRAKPVSVSIAGAKQLTLIAHWGDDFSNGDFADWALARVIR